MSQYVNCLMPSNRADGGRHAVSSAFDGAASGTPYRPNSCQVDKRLSFLVQRPVERHRQGTVCPQSVPMGYGRKGSGDPCGDRRRSRRPSGRDRFPEAVPDNHVFVGSPPPCPHKSAFCGETSTTTQELSLYDRMRAERFFRETHHEPHWLRPRLHRRRPPGPRPPARCAERGRLRARVRGSRLRRRPDRINLTACLDYLHSGDVLVVLDLDRLGRRAGLDDERCHETVHYCIPRQHSPRTGGRSR